MADSIRTFTDVRAAEFEAVRQRREKFGDGRKVDPADPARSELFGLALSGGGIRSATFSLGILQALAKLRLLGRLDYLSTVSGGGYIGAWLTAWISRQFDQAATSKTLDEFQARLEPPEQKRKGEELEAGPVRWLRDYGNYLAPRPALFSADTWTIATLWGRNTLLNLLVLTSILGALLLTPRLLMAAFDPYRRFLADTVAPLAMMRLAMAALAVVTVWACFRTRSVSAGFSHERSVYGRQGAAVILGTVAYCSGWLAALAIYWTPAGTLSQVLAPGAVVVLAMAFLVCLLGSDREKSTERRVARSAVAAGTGIAVYVGMMFGVGKFLQAWRQSPEGGAVQAAIWGGPAMLETIALLVLVLIGVMGRDMKDNVREWWARFGAWLGIIGAGAIFLGCISLYGPLWLMRLTGSTLLTGTATLGWLISTLGGIAGGWSEKTSGKGGGSKLAEAVLPLAPPVFVLGLLLLVAAGLDQLSFASRGLCPFWDNDIEQSRRLTGDQARDNQARDMWHRLRQDSPWNAQGRHNLAAYSPVGNLYDPAQTLRRSYYARLEEQQPSQALALLLALAAFGMALGFAVDINQFSMHQFYRNRLVRCYLGASRGVRASDERQADPFTNLDARDDFPLAELRLKKESGYLGPVPLVNTALNLSNPKQGQQERRAASFVLSPYDCGYFPDGGRGEAFRTTEEYVKEDGGISLGQAFTISGAAASPNMGFHSSAPLAFLMTVFNVRLGWWLPNPTRDRWRSYGPRLGLGQLVAELLALADDKSDFVYVSDGGHFENLGLYELLRRSCRYIICCDGEEDKNFEFGSLGGLIRKAREDFGAEIEMSTSAISDRDEAGRSGAHCAVGAIRYADGSRGTLLYLKAAVTGGEPGDVLQYQTANKEFPHQTTGDQFFSESQFESYRRLGFHAAMGAFQPVQDAQGMLPNRGNALAGMDIDLSRLFVMLRQAWRSGKKWTTASFTRHTERLDELVERLRQDSKLRFLDQQIYLQWKQALPPALRAHGAWWPLADEETFARAFYFCHSLIQLMEDVYLDLDLEHNLEDPDVRGWTNLFRHWSGSDMLRLTFAIVACTFGGRFQSFCERHLGLTRGEIRLGKHEEAEYNEYEDSLLQGLAAEAATRNAQAGEVPVLLDVKPLFVSDAGPAGRGWTLTVGFAFLEEGRLRWIRIQNHLRKMGLGREALEKLAAANVILLPYAEDDSGKAWWEFNSREHVRWAARILSTRIV